MSNYPAKMAVISADFVIVEESVLAGVDDAADLPQSQLLRRICTVNS